MTLPPALARTLAMIAGAMQAARDDWWIIGSAAVALHGAKLAEIRDVDVLLSVADAGQVLPALGVPLTPGVADERFRSHFYSQWREPPVAVDFMAGFHVHGTPLTPATRQALAVGGGSLFVPDRAELLEMLHYFGRPKDLERARLLAIASTTGP